MAITISIPSSLTLDESTGLTDNDFAVSYDSSTNQLSSAALDQEFLDYIEGLFTEGSAAEDTALGYVQTIGGASSANNFITVTRSAGETISNLYFSVTGNGLITTTTSLNGEPLYFHVGADTDFATLTTSATAGAGRVVAAFYLDESAPDPVTGTVTAQVQMVTFEPLLHADGTNPDDDFNFSDVLQVSVASSTNFTFDNLPSGNFLYAAFGNTTSALLITGDNLSVSRSGSKFGEVVKNESNTVNTSQAAPGAQATIGIDSQHFTAGGSGQNLTDGTTANFTFVSGFAPLTGQSVPATGTNVQDIDYSGYINTNGAGIDISQLTGSSPHADLRISVWEAGGGTTPEEGFSYVDNNIPGGTTNVNDDSALHDDTAVAVFQVKVRHAGTVYTFDNVNGNGDDTQAGITVHFESANTFTVVGLGSFDSVDWTAFAGDTFNRVKVQALSTTNPFDLGGVHITQGSTSSMGLGSHLFLDDDGPSIDRNTATVPTLTNDDTAIPDTAGPTSFAGLFTGTFGNDGFKDSNNDDIEDLDAIRYALGVSASGVFSGLTDSLSGDKIYLYLESGVVRGRVGLDDNGGANPNGAIAFEISVNADNGDVTFVQNRSVVHDDPGDPSETGVSAAGLAAAGLVTLTATIEDGDTDTDTAVAEIGNAFKFEDDGPTITRNAVERPLLTTDDSDITDTAPAVSFATLFDHNFGKDGFKDADDNDVEDDDAISFALSLKNGNGTISGLTATVSGDAILLRVNADGDIEGYLANSTSTLAFKIDLNPLTGTISLIQYLAVEHDDPNDAIESGASAAKMAADLIVLTATIRDGDGDSDSDPAQIGDAFRFEDDGPTINAPGTEPTLTVDESDFAFDDTQSFADVFSRNFGNDGEADSDASTYELGINAGSTGLYDTETGLEVVLVKDGDDVVGLAGAGGPEVFRVSVAANGDVTLDQSRAVVHDPDSGPDQSTTLANDNLITLTATITDGDGDTDSATIDIARNLNFEDDAPSVSLDRDPAGFATVDETNLALDATSVTVLLNPTIDYGADGEGTAVYSLDVTNTGPTNLETTDGQAISLVQFTETEVHGVYGTNQIAFIVLIDSVTGKVTLDQVVALRHPTNPNPDDSVFLDPGFLDAVLTVTDKDGDEASDPADIGPALEFKDDGPSVDAPSVPVVVDDDGGSGGNAGGDGDSNAPRVITGSVVPIFDFGADGPGDPISYTITLANLVNPPALESQGATVKFAQDGNFLTGYVDTDGSGSYEALNDREVFTFDLDGSTGDFEFTLIDQIDHPTAGTEDDLTINLGVLLQAIDGDGDASDEAAPIQLNIDFDDDSPVITEQISDGIVDGDAVPSSVTNSLNGAVGFDENDANDETGAGVKTYTFSTFTTPQNAWPNLFAVMSDDKTTINYYESDAAGADLVYSITLDQTGAGSYTFTVHKQTTSQKLEFDFADLPSGQNLFGVLVDRDDNGVLQVDGKGLLVVGRDAILDGSGGYTNASDTINTSKGGGGVTIGVDNQMFDPSDGAIFVFLDNPDDKAIGGLNPGGLTQNTADDADTLGFVATYNTTSAELEVVQKQGSAVCGMRITAYNVDVPGPDNEIDSAANPLGADVNQEGRDFIVDPLAGGTAVSITSVQVFDRANPNVLLLNVTINQQTGAITHVTAAASGYSVTATETVPGNDIWTVNVRGFNANDSIVYTTISDHDAVLTEGTSGKWDLGGINLTESIDLPDQVFDFTVAINDYDGDSGGGAGVAFANFQVGVDGTGAADDGIVTGVDPLVQPIAPLAAETIGFETTAFGTAHQAADFDFAHIFTLGQQYV